MSFFNLLLVTLERCPVPTLSEIRVPKRRVRSTNCINVSLNEFIYLTTSDFSEIFSTTMI